MSDSQNEESKGFFYKFDITNPLEGVIQEYENERESFWASKGLDYQIEYDRAERFAQFVLKGTENLANAQKIEEDLTALQYEATKEDTATKKFNEESRKIVKPGKTPSKEEIEKTKELFRNYIEEQPEEPRNENSPLRLVWERFCIDLAWQSADKMAEGANRIFNLYRMMRTFRPSRPTIDYLLRLSRCYIWGFDPECVILCRSILDAAFQKKISYDICEKYFGQKEKNYFTLDNRIEAAFEEGFIDYSIKKLAIEIKTQGNNAVHKQPDSRNDAWKIMRDTINVLEVLFSK